MANVTSLNPPTSAGEERQDLGAEAPQLGVAREHLEQVAGEQSSLVPAGAGADLDQDVLVVVGVALDHRQANLLREPLEPVRRLRHELAQLGVVPVLVQELAGALEVVTKARVLLGQLVRGLELAVLAADLRVALAVGDHLGVGHLALELREAALDLFDELVKHGCDGPAPYGDGSGRCGSFIQCDAGRCNAATRNH